MVESIDAVCYDVEEAMKASRHSRSKQRIKLIARLCIATFGVCERCLTSAGSLVIVEIKSNSEDAGAG